MAFEPGVYTFGDTPRTADGATGHRTGDPRWLETVHVAEEACPGFFGFGEHHIRAMPAISN